MESGKTITYYCFRSALTTILATEGYDFKRAPSPWRADRFTWVFELDKRGVQIAADYFRSIGKPVPEYLAGVLAE